MLHVEDLNRIVPTEISPSNSDVKTTETIENAQVVLYHTDTADIPIDPEEEERLRIEGLVSDTLTASEMPDIAGFYGDKNRDLPLGVAKQLRMVYVARVAKARVVDEMNRTGHVDPALQAISRSFHTIIEGYGEDFEDNNFAEYKFIYGQIPLPDRPKGKSHGH